MGFLLETTIVGGTFPTKHWEDAWKYGGVMLVDIVFFVCLSVRYDYYNLVG